MKTPTLFEKLSLNKYYKYILYVGGIIFILSLFIDVKYLNQNLVQSLSLRAIVIGIIIWFIEDNIFTFTVMSLDSYEVDDIHVIGITVAYYAILGAILYFGLIQYLF